MKKLWIAAPMVLLLLALFFLVGCSSGKEGFAIYYTKTDIRPDKMEMLSHVEIADEPVISEKDIVSYNKSTHEIELTEDAYRRLTQFPVSVIGTSFVACVDKQPVYAGAFWSYLSSISYNGVTIIRPIRVPLEGEQCIITIGLGYPGTDFFKGEDPRNNPVIMQALEKAGKLK